MLALERFVHAFVTARAPTFQARATRGCIREGHGDLRAEHVLVNGDTRVVDCVEFDRTLRELDVGDDLGFLVFDLAAQGAGRFATILVEAYRNAGGDPGDDSPIAFYAAYRAAAQLATRPPAAGTHARVSLEQPQLAVGTEFAGHRIDAVLGRGGMGELARHAQEALA